MKIKTLELQNFRRFEQASIEFSDNNLAVFIGSNGKGKSSILDALGMLLADFILCMFGKDIEYEFFPSKKDISIKKTSSEINLDVLLKSEKTVKLTILFDENGGEMRINPTLTKINIDNKETNISIVTHYLADRATYSEVELRKEQKNKQFSQPQLEAFVDAFQSTKNTFQNLLHWYRNEEDKENELIRKERNFSLINPKLEAVRQSLKVFFSNLHENSYQNLRAKREDNASTLVISKNGEDFSLAQLSDGEKMLLAMVGDIARRLAIANPALGEKAHEGEGIVLIDEIELHLHPRWQRLLLPALQATFPNVQFIVTTHSPQVLSEVKAESIFILEENGIFHPSTNPLGRDSNSILEQVMGTSKRPKDVQDDIEKYLKLIQNNQLTEANALKESLLTRLDAKDAVFTQADAIIFKKQLLNS
ncbi:MAG: DUF2813 domain-containing protein [Bacteroidetes bacterium]|nr:MAG: DUF2813 domain-containing protein [Bacteroidota bacterium]